ncbi:hypothetical protein Hanom_Chr11g01045911 [Helianthus anomalus]
MVKTKGEAGASFSGQQAKAQQDKRRKLIREAALKCYDNEVKTMYDQEIQEWIATLDYPPFKALQKMKLIGTVNGVKVEMS